MKGSEKREILTNEETISKTPSKDLAKSSKNTNKDSLKTDIQSKGTTSIEVEEKSVDNRDHLFCSACNRRIKSNSDLKKHQKTEEHLFNTDLVALLLKNYGNMEIYDDSINYLKNIKSEPIKYENSILIRKVMNFIKEKGGNSVILDFCILRVKYYPRNLKYIEELGDIYAEFEDYKNAILTYKEILVKTTKKSLIQSKLRDIYFKIGDHENAFNLTKDVVKPGPHIGQIKLDSLIKRDWNRMRSDKISENNKLPAIPKKILEDKIKEFEQRDRQIMFWHLKAPPTSNELAILKRYMYKIKAKYMHEIDSIVHYRIFDNKNNTSIHIKIIKKAWGIIIKSHRDLFKHQHTLFDKTCLELMSKMYLFLKNKRGGNRFLIPRQEIKFQSYLGHRFVEKNRYRR